MTIELLFQGFGGLLICTISTIGFAVGSTWITIIFVCLRHRSSDQDDAASRSARKFYTIVGLLLLLLTLVSCLVSIAGIGWGYCHLHHGYHFSIQTRLRPWWRLLLWEIQGRQPHVPVLPLGCTDQISVGLYVAGGGLLLGNLLCLCLWAAGFFQLTEAMRIAGVPTSATMCSLGCHAILLAIHGAVMVSCFPQ